MKSPASLICTCVILSFLSPIAHAAPEAPSALGALTLEEALSEAKSQSPEFLRAQAAEEEASWKKWEALAPQIPQLSLTGQRLISEQYPAIPFNGVAVQIPTPFVTSLNINASWTVFDGLQTFHAYRAAKLNSEAASHELSRAESELDGKVRLRFYQALGAQLLAQVADQNLRTLQDHLDKSQALLSEGQATRFDILRVKVQLDEAVSEKAAAEDTVVLARSALAEAMGLSGDTRPVEGRLPEPRESDIPISLRFDERNRDDLQARMERADAASELKGVASSAWLPRISLFYTYQVYNAIDPAGLFSINYANAYLFGVSLGWSLFDGGASIAKIEQSKAASKQAELGARQALIHAPNEFDQWRRKFRYSTALYRARAQAIVTAEESVRLAKIGYQAGTRTSTDMLDAELDLFRARAGAVRAQVDAAEARINLELALGRKF